MTAEEEIQCVECGRWGSLSKIGYGFQRYGPLCKRCAMRCAMNQQPIEVAWNDTGFLPGTDELTDRTIDK